MLDGGLVPFVLRPEQPLGTKATAFHLIGDLGWFIYDAPSHNKRVQHEIAHGGLKVDERLRLVARDGCLRYESSDRHPLGRMEAKNIGFLAVIFSPARSTSGPRLIVS